MRVDRLKCLRLGGTFILDGKTGLFAQQSPKLLFGTRLFNTDKNPDRHAKDQGRNCAPAGAKKQVDEPVCRDLSPGEDGSARKTPAAPSRLGRIARYSDLVQQRGDGSTPLAATIRPFHALPVSRFLFNRIESAERQEF